MATTERVITHIGWHELIAPDVERAEAFYASAFGWVLRTWRPGAEDYAMVHALGRNHGGFHELDRMPHWLVYVEVEHLDWVERVTPELGGRILVGPEEIPDIGRFVVLGDPEGATLAAIEVHPQGSRPTGVFAWDELLTADPGEALRFYGRLFGWEAEPLTETYSVFRTDGEAVAGLTRKPETAPASCWLAYVEVPNLEAALARAEDFGALATLKPVTVAGVGRFAVMLDPVGAPIGLFEPK